jgi:hypothetical protein
MMFLLPLSLSAQEKASPEATNQSEAAGSKQANFLLDGESGSSAELTNDTQTVSNAEANAAQQPNAKPTQSTPPSEPAPKIPGSMVGYIDNPIVESQIRIRFDDAFEDRFPDRSEFFYAKCSCYRLLNTVPPLKQAFDPNAPGPGTAIPTAINYQQLYMNAEYSPVRRFSAFVEVPIRWLQPQGFFGTPPGNLPPGATTFGNQSGLSDVIAGFKMAAVASEGTYLTFQFKSYFPSGDASKGLGTNHYSIEPSLLLYHKLSSRFTFEGQVGDWHPIGGSAGVPITNSEGFAGDIFFYGIGPSYRLYSGNRFGIAPVLELFGWHVLGGFQTNPNAGPPLAANEVSGLNIVNLKVGVRTSIGFHNSFYVGFGQALTHDDWYKHIVRLEYRYTF